MCKLICEQRPIGMILVDGTKMKLLMLPSPQRCLAVINEMLPVIARNEVDALIKESQDAEYTLCSEPTNTVDYVNALNFLSEIQLRVSKSECLRINSDWHLISDGTNGERSRYH